MSSAYSSGVKFSEGDQIKEYRVAEYLGSGGYTFYGKAVGADGKPVFLKKYRLPGPRNPWYDEFVAYQHELKSRVQRHPAAAAMCYEFKDFFELKREGTGAYPLKVFYQVFEWVAGGNDLRHVVESIRKSPGAFDWKQRVIFARVLMAAIRAIHEAGIIHTDLKPENVYLLPEPAIAAKYKLRLIDMDFSLIVNKKAPWHGASGYVGTPLYQSPEHLRMEVPVAASDVFTSALILGELIGAGHPWRGDSDSYETAAKAGGVPKVELQQPIAEAPDAVFVNHVINGALRPEPSRRPTAEQLLNALNGKLTQWDGLSPSGTATFVPPVPLPTPASVAVPSAPAKAAKVALAGPGGEQLVAAVSGVFGRPHFKRWHNDYERFMAPEQFRLEKCPDGSWTVSHCEGATNHTTCDGIPVDGAVRLRSGMVLAVGKTGKCAMTVALL